jgi:hypothetical protein
MKLAMGVPTAPRNAARIKMNLHRAHLSSTYLWSLNYKPFGAAAFHQAKMELLENFVATQDEDWDDDVHFVCDSAESESAQKVSSQPPLDEPVNLGNRNGSDQDYGDLNTKQGIINCYQLSSRNDSYNVVPPSDVNVSL